MNRTIDIPVTNDEPLASILSTLRLEERETGSYLGTNLIQVSGQVYGGQVFAQAVVAAADTLEDDQADRQIHSITASFLRAGDLNEPVSFDVEEILDARSFSTRRIHASQFGKTILTATASFQKIQLGLEHESPMPEAPDPETLESSVQFFGQLDMPAAKMMSSTNAVDMRHVSGPIWLKPGPIEDTTLIWFRLRSPMPEGSSQLLHRALLAYATDQFMMEPIMRKHGVHYMGPQFSGATLDHSIWWHRDFDMSDWVLAELTSPSAQGGRGLTLAKYFQGGHHIATMAQEAMFRIRNIS